MRSSRTYTCYGAGILWHLLPPVVEALICTEHGCAKCEGKAHGTWTEKGSSAHQNQGDGDRPHGSGRDGRGGCRLGVGGTRPRPSRGRVAYAGCGGQDRTAAHGQVRRGASRRGGEDAAAESLRTCVDADDKGAKAVEAARNSVGDWAAHIRAMDDLQAGVHSEEHTKSVWGVTRLRGPDRLSRFLSADKEYKEARDACAEVKQTEMSAGQRAALDDCQDVGQQIDTALSSADDALDEWRGHLKNMADRRAGSLDPDVAMTRWLAAYEKAPTNIKAFEAAEKAYSDTSVECTADGA